eukprot:m.23617 g.23617  ORF g.23617 m.23617 type:complete len:94 (-) comp11028_c0_seq2:537-818(-)
MSWRFFLSVQNMYFQSGWVDLHSAGAIFHASGRSSVLYVWCIIFGIIRRPATTSDQTNRRKGECTVAPRHEYRSTDGVRCLTWLGGINAKGEL